MHSPDQREGDVANIHLFPNAAFAAKIIDEEQRRAEAARAEAAKAEAEREAHRKAEEEQRRAEAARAEAAKAEAEREAHRKAEEEQRRAEAARAEAAKAEAEREAQKAAEEERRRAEAGSNQHLRAQRLRADAASVLGNFELVGANHGSLRLVGAEVSTSIALESSFQHKISATLQTAGSARSDRFVLTLENVRGSSDAPDVSVYINVPEQDDSAKHPDRLAGIIPLFGLRQATVPDAEYSSLGLNFALELTPVIDTLCGTGALTAAQLRVRLVPTQSVPEKTQFSIGRISLFRERRGESEQAEAEKTLSAQTPGGPALSSKEPTKVDTGAMRPAEQLQLYAQDVGGRAKNQGQIQQRLADWSAKMRAFVKDYILVIGAVLVLGLPLWSGLPLRRPADPYMASLRYNGVYRNASSTLQFYREGTVTIDSPTHRFSFSVVGDTIQFSTYKGRILDDGLRISFPSGSGGAVEYRFVKQD